MSDETASCACSRVAVSREFPGHEAHRCVECGAFFMRRALYNPQREQTAATILAALIQAYDGVVGTVVAMSITSDAVTLADALRAELARKP